MQAHPAESFLGPAPHVIKERLCPVYEGFCVQAVIPQDPPAMSTVATEAALQPLHQPATSAIPVVFGGGGHRLCKEVALSAHKQSKLLAA